VQWCFELAVHVDGMVFFGKVTEKASENSKTDLQRRREGSPEHWNVETSI